MASLFLPLCLPLALIAPLSHQDLESIGRRVWQNEADGKIEGLVDWNQGEHFASLGIGHFIWYPQGPKGPFEESFPSLLKFLRSEGVRLPAWLSPETPCPWPNRAAFVADAASPRLRELRALLAGTIAQQSQFLSNRLDRALPKMLESLPAERKKQVQKAFEHLASNRDGRFAMIDYVNFKGEGVLPAERYQGQGWGLLQVLEALPPEPTAADFSKAAAMVLKRRVQNAPPERREERWLEGWTNRVRAYAR